jgi:hypothetical protein
MAVPDDGFKVNVGGHLIEDPGSGLTKVFEHGATSAEMPVWATRSRPGVRRGTATRAARPS